jgi:hypothetical protein
MSSKPMFAGLSYNIIRVVEIIPPAYAYLLCFPLTGLFWFKYFDAVIKDGVQGAVSVNECLYSSHSLSVWTFHARGLLNWELKNKD